MRLLVITEQLDTLRREYRIGLTEVTKDSYLKQTPYIGIHLAEYTGHLILWGWGTGIGANIRASIKILEAFHASLPNTQEDRDLTQTEIAGLKEIVFHSENTLFTELRKEFTKLDDEEPILTLTTSVASP